MEWVLVSCTIQKIYVLSQTKLIHLPHCCRRWLVEATKQWMWVINHEVNFIGTMEWVESYKYCIKLKQKHTYLDVPDNGQFNWWNNEWERWSIKVSESKLFNDSNSTKRNMSGKKCTSFSVRHDGRLNWQNNKTYDLQCTNSNNSNQSYKYAL